MPDHNIEVIDLGLTVPQAIEDGLETEEFTRRSRTCPPIWSSTRTRRDGSRASRSRAGGRQDALRLHPLRAERLLQRRAGRVHRGRSGTARRASEARAPAGGGGPSTCRTVRDEALTEMVWAEIADMVDIDAMVRRLVADHPDLADVDEARIRDTFTDDPTRSWRSSAQQLVNDDIDATPGLADAVRAQLAEQLATPQDHEE